MSWLAALGTAAGHPIGQPMAHAPGSTATELVCCATVQEYADELQIPFLETSAKSALHRHVSVMNCRP
jgi:hypothetical protein